MHGGEAHRVQGLADSLLRFLRQICVGQALRNAAHPIFGFGVGAQCVVGSLCVLCVSLPCVLCVIAASLHLSAASPHLALAVHRARSEYRVPKPVTALHTALPKMPCGVTQWGNSVLTHPFPRTS